MKTIFKLLLFTAVLCPFCTKAQNFIADAIKQDGKKLHYPLSVKRFYQQENFRRVWVLKDTAKTPAWEVMLLLDCISQYGLSAADYYPNELTYDNLHLAQTGTANDAGNARFDVMMTDAIITLINNLHYGKLNPDFPYARVDAENITELKGDKILIDALEKNNLTSTILNVQPQVEAYTNLQHHMLLLTTKFSGHNYVRPVNDVREMAMNMERLRWINTTGKKIPLTCAVKDGILIRYATTYKGNKNSAHGLRVTRLLKPTPDFEKHD